MSVIFVGHRGVAGTHPENTMVSIQAAKQLGMKWLKLMCNQPKTMFWWYAMTTLSIVAVTAKAESMS